MQAAVKSVPTDMRSVRRLREAEREILGDVMAASDVDADAIEIEGRVHRHVLKSPQTYMTAAGEVTAEG
jgi:hypothetical protein